MKHLLFFVVIPFFVFSQKPSDTLIFIEKDTIVKPSLKSETNLINEVVISGTLKSVSRLESPVPVEVYSAKYFSKNPTSNVLDALQMVNGVRPQLNCNICNTGDIHINGLEGPYTMVLIDGMPIVSSLGTVYGLSGIPNALVERIEVVKGPASSLYGSEAVGGLINIITKSPLSKSYLAADFMSTSWGEYSVDLALSTGNKKRLQSITGLNYFNYQNLIDNNHDGFTDMALQNRFSVFQKWMVKREENRLASFAFRYLYEDRWGGDVRWNKSYRGGNQIYGESIYTNRAELLGSYQIPVREKLLFSYSLIHHHQDSRYGETDYKATQNIAFAQVVWDKKLRNHDALVGIAMRYTYYDDNTPATVNLSHENSPEKVILPGIFVQDEMTLHSKHKLLLGARYDYHSQHRAIFTPRLAYKWNWDESFMFRLNAGTGFRVVNLFTEDHAALTGAREIVVNERLKPEKSYNINLNIMKKWFWNGGTIVSFDFTGFYTYFNNRIVPDYEINPNQIHYNNLEGYATSKGITLNADFSWANGIKMNLGATLMDHSLREGTIYRRPLLTEKFTATWAISYRIRPLNLTVDYTGNLYSPMLLPLLGELDPRKPQSPWWSIQNIQVSYNGLKNLEIYAGVKNLLNWTPNKGNPFIIARTHDPFDQHVVFDGQGQAVATAENPYALTFDPSYVYAPNQGIRTFLGLRFNFK